MYWRCVDRSCLGRATTDENDQVIAEIMLMTTHQKLPRRLQLKLQKRCSNGPRMRQQQSTLSTVKPFRRSTRIQNQLMQQLSCLHYLLSSHPCIGRGRKGFHRYQQHIGGEWAKAMSGAEFLLGSQNDIHVFATEDNLKILALHGWNISNHTTRDYSLNEYINSLSKWMGFK